MIKIKIVIIEDDEFLLKKITKILKREIDEVYSFKNPLEALSKIPELKPDIIISDINMPEMSGLDLYKELKKLDLTIPIILASAFSEPEYFIEAIKLKVKNFIVKPIDLDDLLTELKEFEQELLHEEEMLKKDRLLSIQSKMAAMGEMLSNIAHQWKQPIHAISMCTSHLQLEKQFGNITDKNGIVDEMLESINNSVSYMFTTINDFQNYLKPNKVKSCFYLKDTLEKVEQLISSQLKFHHIVMIKNIDDKYMCNFQNELIQVLINIEKNALDEMVKMKREKVLKIEGELKDNNYIITIHDNAGGIRDEIMNKVFEPFFTTKKEKGTGVGLYIAKQIVESHLNGTLLVHNEKFEHDGKEYFGAKFTLTLHDILNEVS